MLLLLLFVQSCGSNEDVINYKDMEQNMMDLKVYQENLGDQINAKALNDYRLLVRNCNNCHKDNDVDNEVKF